MESIESRKLRLISQIIETESLEVIEAIENLLFEESFEQSISNEEKQLLDNFISEGEKTQEQELEEHLKQRIAHHEANPEKASDAFEAISEIGKTHSYEL